MNVSQLVNETTQSDHNLEHGKNPYSHISIPSPFTTFVTHDYANIGSQSEVGHLPNGTKPVVFQTTRTFVPDDKSFADKVRVRDLENTARWIL